MSARLFGLTISVKTCQHFPGIALRVLDNASAEACQHCRQIAVPDFISLEIINTINVSTEALSGTAVT
jgi:hypothetical protein